MNIMLQWSPSLASYWLAGLPCRATSLGGSWLCPPGPAREGPSWAAPPLLLPPPASQSRRETVGLFVRRGGGGGGLYLG